jgi:hypothetical protein
MNISLPEFILCFPQFRAYKESKMGGETNIVGAAKEESSNSLAHVFLSRLRLGSSRRPMVTPPNAGVENTNADISDNVSTSRGVGTSVYVFSIVAKRKATFYFFRILLDLIIIVWVAIAAFCLPVQEFIARIAILQTTMLTVVAFKFTATDFLPRGGTLTILDIFILGCLGGLLTFVLLICNNYFNFVRKSILEDIYYIDEGFLQEAQENDRILLYVFLWYFGMLSGICGVGAIAHDVVNFSLLGDRLPYKGWKQEYSVTAMRRDQSNTMLTGPHSWINKVCFRRISQVLLRIKQSFTPEVE